MPTLRSHDFRLLVQCIQELYGNLDLSRFPETIFRSTAVLMPSNICSYNEISTRQHHAIAASNVPIDENLFRIWAHHVDDHPLVRYAKKGRWQRPTKTSDLLPQREFRASVLYNEFYKFVATEYQIHVPIGDNKGLIVSLTYNRDTKDFSERERLILDLLSPHLHQSYRIAEMATGQSALVVDDGSHSDEHGRGIVVLSRQGRVILMTPWARSRLEFFYGSLESRSAELPEPIASWIARLLAPDNKKTWEPPPRTLLSREQAGRCLRLAWIDRGPGELPLLILEEEQQENPAAHLSMQLGVSLREAEVLFWVAQGKSNAEIAVILGIRSSTVKTHLGNAYPKLGVSTRAGAAATVWQILSHRGHAR